MCVSFTDLISCIVFASCMNSSLKCTSISNGSVNCSLKHLTSEKKIKTLWAQLYFGQFCLLYNLIVGLLCLMLLLSEIPFHYFRRATSSNLNQSETDTLGARAQLVTRQQYDSGKHASSASYSDSSHQDINRRLR